MNDEKFNDPLADFDPVMETAFSMNDPEAPIAPTPPVPPPAPKPTPPPPSETMEPPPSPPESLDEPSFFDDDAFDIDEDLFDDDIASADDTNISVSSVHFDPPQSSVSENQLYDKNLFKNIKVEVAIELGRTKISLKKLYELKSGAIIELPRLVGEPLDLVINDQVIAKGEVVAVNNNYGIRITHIESLHQIT